MVWYRWKIRLVSGVMFFSASSFNKPQFALKAAEEKIFEKLEFGGELESITVYESDA